MKKIGIIIGSMVAVFGVAAVVILVGVLGRGSDEAANLRYQEAIDVGDAYLDNEEYDKAMACFEMAIKMEPENASAYTRIVQTYIKRGMPDQAAKVLAVANDRAEASELLTSFREILVINYPEAEEKFENGEYETQAPISQEEFDEMFHQEEYEVDEGKGKFKDETLGKEVGNALANNNSKNGGGGLFGAGGKGKGNGNGGGLFGAGGNGSGNGNGNGNGNGSGNGNGTGNGNGNGNGNGSGNGTGGIAGGQEGGLLSNLVGMFDDFMQSDGVMAIDMEIKPEELLIYGTPVTGWSYSGFKQYVLSRCVTSEEWMGMDSGGETNDYIMVDGDRSVAWVYVGADRAGGNSEVVDVSMQNSGNYYLCRYGTESYNQKTYISFEIMAGYMGTLSADGVVTGSYASLVGMSTKDALDSLYPGLYDMVQERKTVYVANGSVSITEGTGEIQMGNNDCNITFGTASGVIQRVSVRRWLED